MDAFDTGSPEFASPEMTEARAEVNDAAVVNQEGGIEVAPDMANPAFDPAPIAPDMAAGTPEGAAEASGGGESAGMGAMDDAFGGQPDTAAQAAPDAAETAMDQAMVPDAPELGGETTTDDPMAGGIVDPADQPAGPDDDDGSLGGG
jgi:hypothetical protein